MDHGRLPIRVSHDSLTSGSYAQSTSASSNNSDELKMNYGLQQSPTESNGCANTTDMDLGGLPGQTPNNGVPQKSHHVIRLSSIEHCMPRAYIRVCLAYRLPSGVDVVSVAGKLSKFARRLVDSKPYLAGYVVPASDAFGRPGMAEIQFTDEDFLNYPEVQVRHLTSEEVPFGYDDLDKQCLPPSVIKPELVSALPEGTDDQHAPVFRMQANIVKDGLIVSVYLHHCISDGIGLGLLITGSVLADDFTFDRYLEAKGFVTPGLHERLSAWSIHQGIVRQRLSWSCGNQISTRHIQYKRRPNAAVTNGVPRPNGRGCIFAFSKSKILNLMGRLEKQVPGCFMTQLDTLQALLWQHMTVARKGSIHDPSVRSSKLFIPVNIRSKLKESLPDSYFGAAVDFACAEMPLSHLSAYAADGLAALAETAVAVREAIEQVNEQYIRQLIALANSPDSEIDVRDVMATNMDRLGGADMYVTSWYKLGLYNATLGMGLGRPDWVRKPWSKDPGSCVVLPNDERKSYMEVLVQMTEADMTRLLKDEMFMSYVVRATDTS